MPLHWIWIWVITTLLFCLKRPICALLLPSLVNKDTKDGSQLQPRHLPREDIWAPWRYWRTQGLHWWYLGHKKGNLWRASSTFRRNLPILTKDKSQTQCQKVQVQTEHIDYLGYIVTPEGVKPNPKRSKSSKPWKGQLPSPKSEDLLVWFNIIEIFGQKGLISWSLLWKSHLERKDQT